MPKENLPTGAESAPVLEIEKKKAVNQAIKEAKENPSDIAEIMVSVYNQGFEKGFSIGLRMEERKTPEPPRKKGFWE